jgi:AcrR family transcriptional regulator
VAERAGLSVGAVYRHFPSKEDLIAAIIDAKLCEVEQVVETAAAVEDAVLAVRALIRSGVELALRRGELTKALLESGALGAVHARADTRRQAIVATMRGMLARGVAQGSFRSDLDPAVAVAMLEAAFLPWSIAALRQERTADELVDRFTELFLGGAANPDLQSKRAGGRTS